MNRKYIIMLAGVFCLGVLSIDAKKNIKNPCDLIGNTGPYTELCRFADKDVDCKDVTEDIISQCHKAGKYYRNLAMTTKKAGMKDKYREASRLFHSMGWKLGYNCEDVSDPYACYGYRGSLHTEKGEALSLYDISGGIDNYFDFYFSGSQCSPCKPCLKIWDMLRNYLETKVKKNKDGSYDKTHWTYAQFGAMNSMFFDGRGQGCKFEKGIYAGKPCGICTKYGTPYEYDPNNKTRITKVIGKKGFPCAGNGNNNNSCANVTCTGGKVCKSGMCVTVK